MDVLFEQRGGLGIATLNRPQALNAMSLGMYRLLAPQIAAWNSDPSIHAITLRGNGRAFCAGGDVRSVALDPSLRRTLFLEEYRFIHDLHSSQKPFVALAHGFTFGGGAGLSVNARYRVAGESLQFAMPEVFIGSIPDVGATRFLGQLGDAGLYLGVTGARIGAGDAMALGLYTHFIPESQWPELLRQLENEPPELVLERLKQPPPPPALGTPAIPESVPGASPLSMRLVREQLKRGAGFDLAQALKLEFRVIQHIVAGAEFKEGIRAVLIDKDRNPRWQYPSQSEVPQSEIDRHFESLGSGELRL
jgi:enoyl-CoA hydratase